MSEAVNPEDLRDQFVSSCRSLARYWASTPGPETVEERTMGVAHSILCLIDGSSSGFPAALDLVCRPHPDDKAFKQGEGEDWVEDGTVINADTTLHELLHAGSRS